MEDKEIKSKILQEIMDLMDQKDGESLKMHPKVLAAKVEVEKPDAISMMKSKMGSEEVPNESPELEMKEGPDDEEELDPEMIQKLLEMHKDLK